MLGETLGMHPPTWRVIVYSKLLVALRFEFARVNCSNPEFCELAKSFSGLRIFETQKKERPLSTVYKTSIRTVPSSNCCDCHAFKNINIIVDADIRYPYFHSCVQTWKTIANQCVEFQSRNNQFHLEDICRKHCSREAPPTNLFQQLHQYICFTFA